jgi:hypothetical protein
MGVFGCHLIFLYMVMDGFADGKVSIFYPIAVICSAYFAWYMSRE